MLRSLAIVGAISLALLPPMYLGIAYPVNAQEAPKCVTVADAQKDIAEAGAEIVGGGTFHGKNTDEMLVVQAPESIVLFFFKDGCLVTGFIADEAVPQKDA
jgi:hypothetical protein